PAAVQAIQRVLERLPDDAAAQIQAAFVFAAANDLPRAAELAQTALARDPQQVDAWRALAEVRLGQRRLSEAETAIETALQ
ncbi:tetratricopeptide repeat protein, partial [Klebsiella pneumoniae]|nr:tetratricopeptide repeat protein [Klebsiella pneumoniae]